MADNLPPGRRVMTVAEREGLVTMHKAERAPGLGTNVARATVDAVRTGANGLWGAVSRIPAGVRVFVSTVTGQTWFGPNQPLPPQAQQPEQGVVGRQLDYPFGWNLLIQPRQEDGGISFWQLRALADACDVVKAAIQVRKDEIEAFDWEFVPEDPDVDPDTMADQIAESREFWERPDGNADWTTWLRKWIDDMLTVDAVAIYPERTRGGQVGAMHLIDSGTIKRVIDEYGRTPPPPDPAYQQIIKGFPAVDYTRDELFYTMRDPRTWKLYGHSPVEQIITTINLALRRTNWQLNYYTEGTVPDMIVSLPKEWSADQIAQFQQYMDGLLTDNMDERRKMRFIPAADKIELTKKEILKDEFDDYLVRIVCFVLRVSPQALMKQMNRAQAQQAADTVKEQGLMPTLRYLERQINRLNRDYRGVKGIKFAWKIEELIDPLKQAQERQLYVEAKVLTPDEIREDMGRPVMTAAQREAAWPTPPAPELGGNKPNSDDPFASSAAVRELIKSLAASNDPERLTNALQVHGDNLVKAVRAMKPTVVELKPRVSLRVDGVNVSTPAIDMSGITEMVKAHGEQLVKAVGEFAKATGPRDIYVEPHVHMTKPGRTVHKRSADGTIVSEPAE